MRGTAARKIFQFRLVVLGSEPAIWRRIQVASDSTLKEFADILQICLDWPDADRDEFVVHGKTWMTDGSAPRLDELIGVGETFHYHYRTDGHWTLELQAEKILDADTGYFYPRALAGERAGPPPRAGNIESYQSMVPAISNPEHVAHTAVLAQIGTGYEQFNPEVFDLDILRDDLYFHACDELIIDDILKEAAALLDWPKDELEAFSNDGLINILRIGGDRVPFGVIEVCVRRGSRLLQELRQAIGEFAVQDGDDDAWWLPFHAALIAGRMHGPEAGEFLLWLLKLLNDAAHEDMQDTLYPYWTALFLNKDKVFTGLLRKLAEGTDLTVHTRALAATIVLGMQRTDHDAFAEGLDWVAGMLGNAEIEHEYKIKLAFVLLEHAREPHRALLDELADGFVKGDYAFSRADVEARFNDSGQEEYWKRFANPWGFYEEEAILARQQAGFDDSFAGLDAYGESDFNGAMLHPPDDSPVRDGLPEEPYVRTSPRIGRNDPCPCGSSRKYKKCCLDKRS